MGIVIGPKRRTEAYISAENEAEILLRMRKNERSAFLLQTALSNVT